LSVEDTTTSSVSRTKYTTPSPESCTFDIARVTIDPAFEAALLMEVNVGIGSTDVAWRTDALLNDVLAEIDWTNDIP